MSPVISADEDYATRYVFQIVHRNSESRNAVPYWAPQLDPLSELHGTFDPTTGIVAEIGPDFAGPDID